MKRPFPVAGEIWRDINGRGWKVITPYAHDGRGDPSHVGPAHVVYAEPSGYDPKIFFVPMVDFMGVVRVDGGYEFRFRREGDT